MQKIVLLTDFGLDEPYVGQMKGVLAAAAPEASIIDLCHNVPPFDLIRATFFLEASRPYYPMDSIFVCVIDPGVGSERAAVCLEKFGQKFIAPDNGLLSLTLDADGPATAALIEPERVAAGAVSNTFHGRDLFAPAAAMLAKGLSTADLGAPIEPAALIRLKRLRSCLIESPAPRLEAAVLHVDRFGNLILNVRIGEQPGFFTSSVDLASPDQLRLRKAASYAELGPEELGLIAGSQGFYELSMNRRSAAQRLGIDAGDVIAFTPSRNLS